MTRDMESFVKDCAICIRHWEQTNKREPQRRPSLVENKNLPV